MTQRDKCTARLLSLSFVLLASSLCVVPDATGAELAWVSESPANNESSEMTLHIRLIPAPGESVAALQFDCIQPTATKLLGVRIGPAAKEAAKTISFNEMEPGRVRVIVAGLNRNAMGEGTVATLHYRLDETSMPKGAANLERVILSDPFGSAVPVSLGVPLSSGSGGTASVAVSRSSSVPPAIAWAMTGVVAAILVGISIMVLRPSKKRKVS